MNFDSYTTSMTEGMSFFKVCQMGSPHSTMLYAYYLHVGMGFFLPWVLVCSRKIKVGGREFVVGFLGLGLFVEGLGQVVDGYFRIKGYFLVHVKIAYLKGWVSLSYWGAWDRFLVYLWIYDASWCMKTLFPILSLICAGTTYNSIQYLVFRILYLHAIVLFSIFK